MVLLTVNQRKASQFVLGDYGLGRAAAASQLMGHTWISFCSLTLLLYFITYFQVA